MVEQHPKALETLKGLNIKLLNDYRTFEKIKVLDRVVFPVKYTEQHYNNVISSGFHPFSHVAYFHDNLVGVVTCRLEKTSIEGVWNLYVMTIGVLKPYKRLGIGAKLMQKVLNNISENTTYRIAKVYLHVQKGSTAYSFYNSFNFTDVEVVEGYYKELDEHDAIKMEKIVPQVAFSDKDNDNSSTRQDILNKNIKKYSVSCCDLTSKKRQGCIITRCDIPRHTVVSFEGDACFDTLTRPPPSGNTNKVTKRKHEKTLCGGKRYRSGDQASSNDDYGTKGDPNAMMVSFWHSCPVTCDHTSSPVFKGNCNGPHMVVLRLIITTTAISVGNAIICDRGSIAQNASPEASISAAIEFQLREEGLNYPYEGPDRIAAENRRMELHRQLNSRLPLHHWPSGSPFYQGLGERHRDTREIYHPLNDEGHNIDVGFPYNMLHLQPCVELGRGHLEVIAGTGIPRGTCFGYCGATYGARKQIQSSHQRKLNSAEMGIADEGNGTTINSPTSDQGDIDIYSFQLNAANTVVGSGITRYINHRYNFSKFGNVQFGTIVIPVSTGAPVTPTSVSQKGKRTSTRQARNYLSIDENGLLTLPFFISTTDIAKGEKVLATSYGDAYDAELERLVCSSLIPSGEEGPYPIYSIRKSMKSASQSNIFPSSDYTQAMIPRESFVVINHNEDAVTSSIFQVRDVCNVGSGTMLLLTPMHRTTSSTDGEVYAVTQGEMQHFICESEVVGLLFPDDFNLNDSHPQGEGKEDSSKFPFVCVIQLTRNGCKKVANYIQDSPKETLLDQIHWPLLSAALSR